MEADVTLKGKATKDFGFEERTIVSFDIPQEDGSRRSILQRYLHGRVERRGTWMEKRERTDIRVYWMREDSDWDSQCISFLRAWHPD